MFPVDVVTLLHDGLRSDRRPPDGLLHCSGDLVGSLRHSMLSAAGAPRVDSQLVSDIRLMTGTMWHRYVETLLGAAGVKVETEVSVNPGLPEGWSGTADWLFWHPEYEAWVLGDLKTTKGEGIKWVLRDGAKLEHMWQLSAYFWALVEMGFPMVKGFGVLYLPMNDTPDKGDIIEPTLQECEPLDREIVWGQMNARWTMTQEYLEGVRAMVEKAREFDPGFYNEDVYVNDKLAPEQERVQTVNWNGQQGVFDVKLVPHWSAQFCPYPDELCACNKQGVTKIGHYNLDEEYVPRKKFEEIEPVVAPAPRDMKKRQKERENVSEAA